MLKPGSLPVRFGQRIIVSQILSREDETTRIPGLRCVRKIWKAERLSKPQKAVFLGVRNLQNGMIDLDGSFFVEEYMPAMLVCLDEKTNPVYVPVP